MDELLASWGLPALLAVSFAAATLVPLGSEWLLALLLLRGADPVAAVAVASAGNFLGACTTYAVGLAGGRWLRHRAWTPAPGAWARAHRGFDRYGVWALLFTWLPVVGDALCLVAGALRTPFGLFAALTLVGKVGRYAAVALVLPR